MREEDLEQLFAQARQVVRSEEAEGPPTGFTQTLLRRHAQQRAMAQTSQRAAIVSVITALLILAAALGYDFQSLNGPAEDQESWYEMQPTLWDLAGS
jgi:hypothetical protein